MYYTIITRYERKVNDFQSPAPVHFVVLFLLFLLILLILSCFLLVCFCFRDFLSGCIRKIEELNREVQKRTQKRAELKGRLHGMKDQVW